MGSHHSRWWFQRAPSISPLKLEIDGALSRECVEQLPQISEDHRAADIAFRWRQRRGQEAAGQLVPGEGIGDRLWIRRVDLPAVEQHPERCRLAIRLMEFPLIGAGDAF